MLLIFQIVYQKYGDEPECRPPTPLPPAASSDFGDDLVDDREVSPTSLQENSIGMSASQLPNSGYIGLRGGADVASPMSHPPPLTSLPLQLRNDSLVDTNHAAEIKGFVHEKDLPRKDPLQGRDSLTKQQLNGSEEGMDLDTHLAIDVSLKEVHSPVNVQYPGNISELVEQDQKKKVDGAAGRFPASMHTINLIKLALTFMSIFADIVFRRASRCSDGDICR